MKRFEKTKGFIIGIAVCLFINALFIPVLAQNVTKQLTAYYKNIRIILNGEELSLKNVAGDIVEPFIVDGTTYLPVRALAEALDFWVSWDEETQAVIIDSDLSEFETEIKSEPRNPPPILMLGTENTPLVLEYHSIADTPSGITAENFEGQIKYLADKGYTFLFPEEIHDCDKYDKSVILTFDDGYRDNYETAFGILKKYNAKATIFMITNYIGKTIREDEFLTANQIKELEESGLVRVESHTHNHKDLSALINEKGGENKVRIQLINSAAALKEITGRDHKVLCYPYGGFDDEVKKIVSEYYDIAFATWRGSRRDMFGLYRDAIYNDMTAFTKLIDAD